ncbi:MAG TPA: serine/threonine-protein kinase [Herpetosiphonaceae bacterium]
MTVSRCLSCNAILNPNSRFCTGCGRQVVLRDRYRLVRELGRGGGGIVYEAFDLNVGRPCAIKEVSSATPAEQKQLEIEAGILAHYSTELPFIPSIFDRWSDNARTYLAMEYIQGQTLEQLLGQPWSVSQVEDFLRIMLACLSQLHAVSIVHRDIKPGNIICTPRGRYVLVDFGIAKHGASTMTMAASMGSLAYASPEQIQGKGTDARSDLYSLAATAYHLLTGQLGTPAYARQAGVALTPPSQIRIGVPAALEKTLLALLELDRDKRPSDAHEALQLLTAALPAPPPATPMPGSKTTIRFRAQNRTAVLVAMIGGICTIMAAVVAVLGNVIDNPGYGIQQSQFPPVSNPSPFFSPSPFESSEEPTPEEPAPNELALDFTLEDSSGSTVDLASVLENNSVVLVMYVGHT